MTRTTKLTSRSVRVGDCVRLADGRVGRVRAILSDAVRVRVRRATSTRHQFVLARATALRRIDCPRGWMSPPGYVRYLRVTLAKMRTRMASRRRTVNRPSGR